MATSSIARGQLARLAFATETGSYGTAASTGYRYAHYYKANLRQTKPVEADPIIGAGTHNQRDAVKNAPSLIEHGGSLELPVCLNQMGDWLRLTFGAATTSGTTNYTHTFASGQNTLPTATVELNPITGDFRQHVGLAVQRLRVDLAVEGGYNRMMMDFLGYTENMLATTGAGTPTAAKTYNPVKKTFGEVLLGGSSLGSLLSASFTYETGLIQERYVNGNPNFNAAFLAEQAQFFGELRVRYTGATLDTAGDAETEQALEFRFVQGTNNSISFQAPSATLSQAGVPIEGPGGIEQTFQFRCRQTNAAAMVSAILKNQTATYPQ